MLYRGEFEGGCFCRAIRYRFVDVFDADDRLPTVEGNTLPHPGSAVTRVGATNQC